MFLSDLFVAQLLAVHHPPVRSLRILDARSQTAVAREVLQVERLPRSTVTPALPWSTGRVGRKVGPNGRTFWNSMLRLDFERMR